MGIMANKKSWVWVLGCIPLLVIILLVFKIFMSLYANKQLSSYIDNQDASVTTQQSAADTKNILYVSAESMFSEVLKVPSKEGLVFMQVYADAIEDDKVTVEEYKTLQKVYGIFAEARPKNALVENDSDDTQFNKLDGESVLLEDLGVDGEH